MRHTQPPNFAFKILLLIGGAHLLNDLIQSMLTATYPLLEMQFQLNYMQIGTITLIYQLTASILQPSIGYYTDRTPKPKLLPLGMGATSIGITILAFAPSYQWLLVGAGLMGIGSSIFHPEAVRLTRTAAGGRYGTAQSIFQVGGNLGSAFGPLLAALLVVKYGRQQNIALFLLFAVLGISLLNYLANWGKPYLKPNLQREKMDGVSLPYGKKRTIGTLLILALLIFSKYFYMASLTNFYTFYLIEQFAITRENAVLLLFLFLASVAIGTLIGGPVGDRIGRRRVIWISIIGAAPFALILPYTNIIGTVLLSIIIGLILSSAFSAIVVFAQELIPNNVGMVAGLFFGLMFGMSGIGAALLGYYADLKGLSALFQLTSYLPLLGIIALLLPNLELNSPK